MLQRLCYNFETLSSQLKRVETTKRRNEQQQLSGSGGSAVDVGQLR
jgi:hypothetical protein